MLNKKGSSLVIRYTLMLSVTFIFLSTTFTQIMIKIFSTLIFLIYLPFTKVEIINENLLMFENGSSFLLIEQCIAASGYLILFIFIFAINFEFKKIALLSLKLFLIFTLFNLMRILSLIYLELLFSKEIFDFAHFIFFEVLSAFVTVLLLVILLKTQTRKEIPFYSDITYLLSQIKK